MLKYYHSNTSKGLTDMTQKIKKYFSCINKLSKNLIKYGSLLSYLLILIGIYMLFSSSDYYSHFVAEEFIKSSVSVFAEFIIGALFIDLVINVKN